MGERCVVYDLVCHSYQGLQEVPNAMDGTEDEMLWAIDSDKESSDSDDE